MGWSRTTGRLVARVEELRREEEAARVGRRSIRDFLGKAFWATGRTLALTVSDMANL